MKDYILGLFVSILLLGFLVDTTEAQVTFGTGKMDVRVDDYGAIRIFTTEGTDTVQQINRISLLVAGNADEVMDYWNDLEVVTPTELVASPSASDYEVSGAYDNAYSGLPPSFLIEQHIYGWTNGNFCLVKCVIKNQETAVTPALAGLDIVQYVDETWENDHIFYDVNNQMMVQFDTHYIGVKILSEQTTSAQVFKWFDGYEILDTLFYNMMTKGTFYPDTFVTDVDGGVGILAGQSSDLQPDASKTFYFAIAAGTNEIDMLANMQAAQQKYGVFTSVKSDLNNIPTNFTLDQNYPNPFNPSTNISFGLPERSNVVLKVFNTLGEQVAELVNESLEAGTYYYNFNAANLTSGVYVYSLQTDAGVISKKMTLLK